MSESSTVFQILSQSTIKANFPLKIIQRKFAA